MSKCTKIVLSIAGIAGAVAIIIGIIKAALYATTESSELDEDDDYFDDGELDDEF